VATVFSYFREPQASLIVIYPKMIDVQVQQHPNFSFTISTVPTKKNFAIVKTIYQL